MDFVEPWVIRSALVVGLLAAVNVWLFLLSRQVPEHQATHPTPRRRHPPRP
jgi:hypothetical protein